MKRKIDNPSPGGKLVPSYHKSLMSPSGVTGSILFYSQSLAGNRGLIRCLNVPDVAFYPRWSLSTHVTSVLVATERLTAWIGVKMILYAMDLVEQLLFAGLR